MSSHPITITQSVKYFMKYSKSLQFLPTMPHVNTSTGNYKYFAFYWTLLTLFGLLPHKSHASLEIRVYLGFFTVQGCFIALTHCILNHFDQSDIVGYTQTSNYVEFFQLLSSGVTQILIDLWIFQKRHRFQATLNEFTLIHKKYRSEKWITAKRHFWWYIQLGLLFIVDSLVTAHLDGFSLRVFVGESQYILQYIISGIIISFYTILIVTLKNILREINDLIELQVKVDSAGHNIRKPIQRLLLDRSKVVYGICGDLNDIFGVPFILISFFKILEICNNMLFMVSIMADSRLIGILDYANGLKGSVARMISPSILFAMSFQGHLIRVQVRFCGNVGWTREL